MGWTADEPVAYAWNERALIGSRGMLLKFERQRRVVTSSPRLPRENRAANQRRYICRQG